MATESDNEKRFVVLRHTDHDGTHYDLMIEAGDALATWKAGSPPDELAETPQIWRRIGDHRKAYLDYEGPVSGDRGHVRRHDHGTCLSPGLFESMGKTPQSIYEIEFRGNRLRGRFELAPVSPGSQDWRLRRVFSGRPSG